MTKAVHSLLLTIVIFVSEPAAWAAANPASEDPLQRGEYLLYAGGCISCHTVKDSGEQGFLAGGVALATPFGTFYTPNITPDKETGIGNWSDADFIRALRYGFSPRGTHYYPAFPYTSYSGMKRQDLLDLKAYLSSLPPIKQENKPHALVWYASQRFPLRGWKWLNLTNGEFKPDPDESEQWNRGAYLVRHLGHCGECHTPRNLIGAMNSDRFLSGNPNGPEGDAVPNITPDRETGIGKWSQSDIVSYLESGILPDGDYAGSAMVDVIDDNTSKLTDEDRKAIAVYLKSLPALPKAK
jgi:mono/diheme cytochrome c family protein